MRKFLGTLKNLGKDEEGAALIEYTVLLGISGRSFKLRCREPPPGNRDRARILAICLCRSIVERQLRALHEADVITAAGGWLFQSDANFGSDQRGEFELCAEAI